MVFIILRLTLAANRPALKITRTDPNRQAGVIYCATLDYNG